MFILVELFLNLIRCSGDLESLFRRFNVLHSICQCHYILVMALATFFANATVRKTLSVLINPSIKITFLCGLMWTKINVPDMSHN